MKKILVSLIKGYHKHISPFLPGACRFYPTCSMYAAEAIEKFGVIRGSSLAMWRILRCNPFCKGGYDPVPEKFTFKRQAYVPVNEREEEIAALKALAQAQDSEQTERDSQENEQEILGEK